MPVNIFTTIDGPSAFLTIAHGINDAGQIVGGYTDASGGHGFLLSGGSFIPIDDPSATAGTGANGINDNGQIVGLYDAAGAVHGFLRSGGGTFTTIDVSGATAGTRAFGINNAGTIVGEFSNASGTHGFVRSSGGITGIIDGPSGTTDISTTQARRSGVTAMPAANTASSGAATPASSPPWTIP